LFFETWEIGIHPDDAYGDGYFNLSQKDVLQPHNATVRWVWKQARGIKYTGQMWEEYLVCFINCYSTVCALNKTNQPQYGGTHFLVT